MVIAQDNPQCQVLLWPHLPLHHLQTHHLHKPSGGRKRRPNPKMFFQHYREQAEKEEKILQTMTNLMGQVVQSVQRCADAMERHAWASEMMAHKQEGTYGTMQSHSFYPYVPPIPFHPPPTPFPPPPAFSQTVQNPATSTESETQDESHTTYFNLEWICWK